MTADRRLARRRVVALVASIVVPLVLVVGLGHRGSHGVRNLLIPGAGLYDHDHLVLGVALTVTFVAATVAWVRWGVDWAPAATVVVAVALSMALARDGGSSAAASPVRAAHEFPLVVLVVAALGGIRSVGSRLVPRPRHGRRARREVADLDPVARCHVAAVRALAGDRSGADVIDTDDVRRRSGRIGFWARGRTGGDPYRIDHAGTRAARTLVGLADSDEIDRLAGDAAVTLDGVPASEPGWVRLLDGTLVALALRHRPGERATTSWRAALDGRFGLRRGHRPAAVWTPLGLPVGHAPGWEQSTAMVLVTAAGWRDGADDWAAVRQPTLAAAARGARTTAEERLVAAGRVWLTQLDDPIAAGVIARPTVGADPLAAALVHLAENLTERPASQAAPALALPLEGAR